MEPRSEKIWEWTAIILGIIGFIVLIIFLFQIRKFYEFSTTTPIDMNDTGQMGDFIGGVVGTFFSIAATILILLTYRSQRTELMETRKVLLIQEFNSNFNSSVDLYRNFSDNSIFTLGSSVSKGTISITKTVFNEIIRRNNVIQKDFNDGKIDALERDTKLSTLNLDTLTKMDEIHSRLKLWVYLISTMFKEIEEAKSKGINTDNKQLLMHSLITQDEVALLKGFLKVKGATTEGSQSN